MSVDPLSDKYPWYTPYQFAGNTPIQARDIDGLEPQVEDGVLIGYNVQKGQGPTQITADVNDPNTMIKYGYNLQSKVRWVDIINQQSNNSRFFKHIIQNKYNKFNNEYRKLNMNEGDFINLTFLQSDVFNSSALGQFIGSDNDIYNESVRVFNRAIQRSGSIASTDLVDVNSSKYGDLSTTRSVTNVR